MANNMIKTLLRLWKSGKHLPGEISINDIIPKTRASKDDKINEIVKNANLIQDVKDSISLFEQALRALENSIQFRVNGIASGHDVLLDDEFLLLSHVVPLLLPSEMLKEARERSKPASAHATIGSKRRIDESDEEDKPLKKSKRSHSIKRKARNSDDNESDDDGPSKRRPKTTSPTKLGSRGRENRTEDDVNIKREPE